MFQLSDNEKHLACASKTRGGIGARAGGDRREGLVRTVISSAVQEVSSVVHRLPFYRTVVSSAVQEISSVVHRPPCCRTEFSSAVQEVSSVVRRLAPFL